MYVTEHENKKSQLKHEGLCGGFVVTDKLCEVAEVMVHGEMFPEYSYDQKLALTALRCSRIDTT